MRAASAVSEGVFGHRLAEREKERAGAAAHYAMGLTSGVIYGVAAEMLPMTTFGAGLPFGMAVWLIADETVTPALGLSKRPSDYPPSTRVYSIASHLVYGLTTDLVRRVARRAMR